MRKQKTRLEKFAGRKTEKLVTKIRNLRAKKFYNIGPRCYEYFYGRNLQMDQISWSVCPFQAFPALSNICG